jgi:TonB-linked SusC/RagA family outer membrane protein
MITMYRVRALAAAIVGVVLAAPSARAQAGGGNAVINGLVKSEFGRPLEAANVYITELSISVPTGADGKYTITIPAARVSGQQVNLRVRAIGQQPGIKPIRITAGTQTVNFDMKTDVNRLDEVVVTGVVGEGQERSKVPFAVAHLSTEDLPVPAMDPVTALAGKVSGMRIASTSGRPGSTPEIQLRGVTSINSSGRSTSPLFIVDGAIMNVGSLQELGGLDIESVEVVKGAAGASLYGTRAANGVITIKTKRGGSGSDGVRFNVRTEYGVNDLGSIDWGMPLHSALNLDETGSRFCVGGASNVASCSRTVDWMTEVMRINSVDADTLRTPVTLQNNSPGLVDLQNTYQATPWPGKRYDALAQVSTANPTTLNAVDATGKVGGVRFFVSGSYQDEQGAFRGLNGNNQRRARVNLDYDARPDLTISVSSLYDNGYNDNHGAGFGSLLRAQPGTDYLAKDSLGRAILRLSPVHSPTGNGDTSPYYDNSGVSVDYYKSSRWLGNISGRYYPAEWVTLEGTFAYDNRQRNATAYAVKGYRSTRTSSSANFGNIQLGTSGDESFNGNLTASFRKQLRSDLTGRLQLRGLFDQENQIDNGSTGQQFAVRDVYTTSNASTNKTATSSSQVIKNVGFLTGASLDYKDRYVLDGTFRYDGSSLFGSGNRWAPFGRIAGVWRISQEPWYNLPYVNDLRFRASHGTAGSTPRFDAQYEVYTVSNGNLSLGTLGNKNLKPETTTEDELGADFTLFNRLGTEFTYAHDVTRDQLLQVVTPSSLGFSSQWQNAGTLDNKTFELALNLPVINTRDLTWSMRGTWDRTRTFVTELFTPEFTTNGGTNQGTTTYFHITSNPADTGVANGNPLNRFGNMWGRKFYRQCSDLPASVQSQCGPGKAYQVNGDRFVVWVGDGNDWRDGITKNLWVTKLTGTQSPWGDRVPLYWGMPIIDRPLRGEKNEGIGREQILGNVFPDFRWSYANTVSYKRLSLYGLFDATWGQEIYNQGEGWGLLDFASSEFDAAQRTVETAQPTGYAWRAGPSESTGIGGFYDLLGPNNYSVEDGSFIKLREVSLSYRLGSVRKFGDWSVGLVGRNLKTWTKYSGLDPEVGSTTGSNSSTSALTNSTDAFGFPNVRTFTVFLTTRF